MKKLFVYTLCLVLVTLTETKAQTQKTGVLKKDAYGSLNGDQYEDLFGGDTETIKVFESKSNISAANYRILAESYVKSKLGESTLESALANSKVKPFPANTKILTHGVGGETINWFTRFSYDGEVGLYHEPTKTWWLSFECANLTYLKQEQKSGYVDPTKDMIVQTSSRQDTTFRYGGGSMPGNITIHVTNTNTNTAPAQTPVIQTVAQQPASGSVFYTTPAPQTQTIANTAVCNTCPQTYATTTQYGACNSCGQHGCQGVCQQRRQSGAFGRIMENAAGNFIGNGALLGVWYLLSGGQYRQVPYGTPGAFQFQGPNQPIYSNGGLFQGSNQPGGTTPTGGSYPNQGSGQWTNVPQYN